MFGKFLPLVKEGRSGVCLVCVGHFERFSVMDIFTLILTIQRMQKITQEYINWAYFIHKKNGLNGLE